MFLVSSCLFPVSRLVFTVSWLFLLSKRPAVEVSDATMFHIDSKPGNKKLIFLSLPGIDGEYFIHNAIFFCFGRGHPVIPAAIGSYFVNRLTGMMGDHFVQFFFYFFYFIDGDLDIARLSAGTPAWLVQHDAAVL